MASEWSSDQPLRLLIVDDQNDDAELVVRYLRRHGVMFEWTWASTRAEFQAALAEEDSFDVVVTDHNIEPGFGSFDVLKLLRAVPRRPPCVIVSGAIGEEVAVGAMQAGAADYVSKDNLARLVPVLRRSVEEAVAQHAREEAERRLLESERHLRRLINTAEEGICETDADGRVTFVNARMVDLLGYERQELVGALAKDWVSPSSRTDFEQITGTAAPGIRRRVDLTLVKKDRTEMSAIVSLQPNYDADGSYAGMLAMVTDISERKVMERELERRALHDPLTALPNRTLFMDRLAHALASAERTSDQVALIFLDLDDFKHVNDTYGHEIGDELLKSVAVRLSSVVRPQDTVSRFAGDEFTVLCPGVGDDEAGPVAARIRSALNAAFVFGGQEIEVGASVGITVATGLSKAASVVLHEADTAMYRAKESGGGGVELFDAALRGALARRVQIERALPHTMREGLLELVYQPIVSLDTRQITQFEALLRWEDPELGTVPPMEFIPIAEETGAIIEVGRWVAREAFHAMAEIARAGVGISINLSARQLMDPGLAPFLAEEAAAADVPPEAIHLELTETMLVGDRKPVMDTVSALKEAGFNLVLDDFGTGYSALSVLKRLPFDAIKIDRTFIDGMRDNGEDDAIVTAIVEVARALGIAVVAEGVETVEQAERLTALGAAYAQGYHFARPLTLADVEGIFTPADNRSA